MITVATLRDVCVEDDQLLKTVRAMPKIDLHRHLEGSLRLETLLQVAQEYNFDLAEYSLEKLRPHVQVMPDEPRSSRQFLNKFYVLRRFYQSPSIIRRVVRECIADAAADNVRYLELRFTPRALTSVIECTTEEVVSMVCETVDEASIAFDIQVRLILSMNRNESVEIGESVLKAALTFRDRGVVAIDLAGNEGEYSAEPFSDIFARARAAGLGITVHAGEWAGANSVRDAMSLLGAQRIGHGVRAIESEIMLDSLIEQGVTLEVCPTSNIQSGVFADMSAHPLSELYQRGVKITINTDDPNISGITLSDEIVAVITHMRLTLEDVKACTLNAAHAAFLPAEDKALLKARFADWLSAY